MAIQLGRNVYIKYDSNNVGGSGATWVSVAQQTDGGMEGATDTIDGTTKATAGWKVDVPVTRNWNLSCTTKLDPTDATYTALRNAWKGGTQVWIQLDKSGISGDKWEGQAYITSFGESYPQDGAVELKIEFAMQSSPTTSS